MSISGRFEMPIVQTVDATSPAPSSAAYRVTSMGLQLLLKDSCAEVLSGDIHRVQQAVEEIEKEIWDSLFVHGFQFRSQQRASDQDEVMAEAHTEIGEDSKGNKLVSP